MTIIPFQISETEYSLFVGLDDQNIERCRAYDPAQVDLRKIAGAGRDWSHLRLRVVLVGYVGADDLAELTASVAAGGNVQEALTRLSRGFQYRPAAGDHDGPYLSATDQGGVKH